MIQNPTTIFEKLQNDVAERIMTSSLFAGKKMPDGRNFEVLTEDEGDPEALYTAMLDACGLSIVVQAPTAKFSNDGTDEPTKCDPLVLAVSISEAIVFNRAGTGTGIRLIAATCEVIRLVDKFVPASIKEKLFITAMLKDRDNKPDTGDLVASRICVFEFAECFVDLKPTA